jgi:hypothetical protein
MADSADLLNIHFGRLLVLRRASSVRRPNGKTRPRWLCRCDCGNERIVRAEDLRAGNSTSCGCKQRESARSRLLTHGRSDEPLYKCWVQMKQRCYNPNNQRYPQYGARGIRVCSRWRKSFQTFLADMGPRPNGHTLDRIKVNGNYTPRNCRWVTRAVQSRNKQRNIWVIHKGRRMVAADFAKLMDVSSKALYKVMSRDNVSAHVAVAYIKAHARKRRTA